MWEQLGVCLWAGGNVCLCVQGAALGRELRVAGGRKPPSQVLEDVEGQAAHQGDDSDLPQERQGGNEVNICVEKRAQSQNMGRTFWEGVQKSSSIYQCFLLPMARGWN